MWGCKSSRNGRYSIGETRRCSFSQVLILPCACGQECHFLTPIRYFPLIPLHALLVRNGFSKSRRTLMSRSCKAVMDSDDEDPLSGARVKEDLRLFWMTSPWFHPALPCKLRFSVASCARRGKEPSKGPFDDLSLKGRKNHVYLYRSQVRDAQSEEGWLRLVFGAEGGRDHLGSVEKLYSDTDTSWSGGSWVSFFFLLGHVHF